MASSVPDRIVDSLLSLGPASDAKLAQRLGLVHQQINQACRRLESQGVLTRTTQDADGNIQNRLIPRMHASVGTTNGKEPDPASRGASWIQRFFRNPVVPPAKPAPSVAQTTPITEDEVKSAIKTHLEARGYHVEVRWNRDHGIDIEASGSSGRLVIEAKGEVGPGAQQVNYCLGALGELLQRMSDPKARYGLALPDHSQYRGLVSRLPRLAKERLGLMVFWVRRGPTGFFVDVEE